MTLDVRIGLKGGRIELQFEGSEKLFEDKIEPIFKELIDFGKESYASQSCDEVDAGAATTSRVTASIAMTVKAIASKLGGSSGGEVLYAAVVSLAVVKKKETFTRKEINEEMKQAVGYYKSTYSGNLTGYLDALSKQGVIVETSKDTYAVNEQARKEMEGKLAR
jgi:hypothetical protein